ncbi:MAG: hypothetical protein NVS4B7_00140 [Ktedonobacteraceae bacterium]
MSHAQGSLTIEAILEDRYLVKDILGTGGFSAVYLVQDLQAVEEQADPTSDNLFALKELTDQDKQERVRFTFEGEVLMRLSHPALPRIQRVFEDDKHSRAYILMKYVDGPNLDVLRKQQLGKRFSLPQVLDIMAPIIDAVTYLHCQEPPIIHRDIKPANIIISKTENKAVLVDFGIAKEYLPDSTTTAIRHCSPGYGAPEQYSIGTDLRTDVYGLGATFYTLLTGLVPIDALQRATKLASKGIDPLVSVKKLVPTIPTSVAAAIHRAMSIGNDKRFATVDDLWHALNNFSESEQSTDSDEIPVLNDQKDAGQPAPAPLQRKQLTAARSKKFGKLVLMLCTLLLIIGSAFSLGSYIRAYHGSNTATSPQSLVKSAPTMQLSKTTTSTSAVMHYPKLVNSYGGTAHDLLTGMTMKITLTQVQQNNGNIQGNLTGTHITGSFTGVLDTSRHIFFTVAGQPSYFFEGAVRSDNNLVGNYCSVDAQGQCSGNYGVWSIAPAH